MKSLLFRILTASLLSLSAISHAGDVYYGRSTLQKCQKFDGILGVREKGEQEDEIEPSHVDAVYLKDFEGTEHLLVNTSTVGEAQVGAPIDWALNHDYKPGDTIKVNAVPSCKSWGGSALDMNCYHP